MSSIPNLVDPVSLAESGAERLRRAAVALRCALGAFVAWARSRVEADRGDERGLTMAEIVVIGAILLVAVAAIATVLVGWLNKKVGDITNL